MKLIKDLIKDVLFASYDSKFTQVRIDDTRPYYSIYFEPDWMSDQGLEIRVFIMSRKHFGKMNVPCSVHSDIGDLDTRDKLTHHLTETIDDMLTKGFSDLYLYIPSIVDRLHEIDAHIKELKEKWTVK